MVRGMEVKVPATTSNSTYQITLIMKEDGLCNIPIKEVSTIKEFTSYLKRQPRDYTFRLTTKITTTIIDPMLYEGGGGRSTI